MANRYTKTNLVEDLEGINRDLMESQSTYFLRCQARNGYMGLDLYCIGSDGQISCQSNLEGGSPRDCVERAYKYLSANRGYRYPHDQITRAQAKTMAQVMGIDLEKDFFQLGSFEVGYLVELAKATKYRRPKNANGSLGRYFYAHLQKRVKTDPREYLLKAC